MNRDPISLLSIWFFSIAALLALYYQTAMIEQLFRALTLGLGNE
jgi:hypothetical protein